MGNPHVRSISKIHSCIQIIHTMKPTTPCSARNALFFCLASLATALPVHLADPIRTEVLDSAIHRQVFFSAPIRVNTSGIAFVGATPLTMPRGRLAILSVESDFVDPSGAPVPLSTAYMHHWFVTGYRQHDNRTEYIASFGSGAEYRNVPEHMPAGTAVVTHGDEHWIAQLHVIDLRAASKQDRLPCLECRRRKQCQDGSCLDPAVFSKYNATKMYDQYVGGIFACNWSEKDSTAGSEFCTAKRGVGEEASYRLKYTVRYVALGGEKEPLKPVGGLKPVTGATLKAEAPYSEYNVPACTTDGSNPMCVHNKVSEWVLRDGVFQCSNCPQFDPQFAPGDATQSSVGQMGPATNGTLGLVWATGHQHDGALGIELWLKRPDEAAASKIFHSEPQYGSEEGVAGNELGFIVGFSIGSWTDPIPIPEGSYLRVVSKYDAHPPAYNLDSFTAGAEVARTGVMGYMRMRFVTMDADSSIDLAARPALFQYSSQVPSSMGHSFAGHGTSHGTGHGTSHGTGHGTNHISAHPIMKPS